MTWTRFFIGIVLIWSFLSDEHIQVSSQEGVISLSSLVGCLLLFSVVSLVDEKRSWWTSWNHFFPILSFHFDVATVWMWPPKCMCKILNPQGLRTGRCSPKTGDELMSKKRTNELMLLFWEWVHYCVKQDCVPCKRSSAYILSLSFHHVTAPECTQQMPPGLLASTCLCIINNLGYGSLLQWHKYGITWSFLSQNSFLLVL